MRNNRRRRRKKNKIEKEERKRKERESLSRMRVSDWPSLSLIVICSNKKERKEKKRAVRPTAVHRTAPTSDACRKRGRGMESLNELV